MKIYDDIILKLNQINTDQNCKATDIPVHTVDWPSVTDREMILRGDMAYELGTERNIGIGSLLVTDDSQLVSGDSITLIGPDLPEIGKDTNYARIAIVRAEDEVLGKGQALYSVIRGLEFTRYHFYPKGFMLRISATQKKESVRVGKRALQDGLNFEKVGNLMIEEFKKNKIIQAVKLIYITDPDYDFDALRKLTEDAEKITKTIDHISQNVVMDCAACNLQEICEEVEGLKELHFASEQK